jgi:predicted dinucleotide-binding enzyme
MRLLPNLMTAVAPKEKVEAKSSARGFRIRSQGLRLPVAGGASTVLLATPFPEHWGALVEISDSGSIDVVITVILPLTRLFRSTVSRPGGLPN